MLDLFYKHAAFRFTRQQLMDLSGVDYCDVCVQVIRLSFWRHPFTAEDPLVM